MTRIVECVPNFSEGRDRSVIDAIAGSIRACEGVKLLDVDPGESTNRTVVTFVGAPEHMVEAAFQAAAAAYRLIDMTKHTGEHPRLGAVDVVPFIPVSGVSMEECAELARQFGERVARELGVPVYLYEEAQPREYRRALRDIRHGEYEALAERITQPEWQPDYGEARFNARSGATVTGARFFLVAYNVNILGTSNQAHRLALDIREQGRTVKGPDGKDVQQPGKFKAVKAMGWHLDQFDIAQVTANLDNYRTTPIHAVYEAVQEGARALNVGVAGSEIVGLVPLEAILMAADYYIEKEHLFILDEGQKVRLAIDRLGLSSLHPFRPEEKIIEYLIDREGDGPLASLTVRQFVDAVGARTSAPGGGSVAALMGALGAALGAMVGWLTYGRRKYEHLDAHMRQHIPPLARIQQELLRAVDRDSEAFEDYMNALGMPKETSEEKEARKAAMQEGLRKATRVPLRTMELADEAWAPLLEIARYGQYSSRSDVEVGAKALEAASYGAYRNVVINLAGIRDEAFRSELQQRADALLARAAEQGEQVRAVIDGRSGDA